jgi:hypothetical protein
MFPHFQLLSNVTDYLEIWRESCATGVHPRLVCFSALQPVVKALMMQEVFRNKNILTGAGFSPVIIYTKCRLIF